jgi:hypothetical protein
MAKRSRKNTKSVSLDSQLANEPKPVPDKGDAAYAAGFSAAECPFEEGTEQFDVWNEEWDNAAEAFTENAASTAAIMEVDEDRSAEGNEAGGEEPDEAVDKSVVKAEYRIRYAEAGHPAHCGDELAVLINHLCLPEKGEFDVARFEVICKANEVDLSKYNRTTKGWQGRLRMTGRNILAGRVFANGGVVKTGGLEMAEPEYKLSAEWMASRRKVKSPE